MTTATKLRILVTGSRNWTDVRAISRALNWAIITHGFPLRQDVTVVHGWARGADSIAGFIAHEWGMSVETHPANWAQYGKCAGYLRNREMVELGADICLAFPLGESKGTRNCIELARNAGIRVVDWTLQGVKA